MMNGGYSTMGVETEESCAQIITALCSLGIDPETDSRFIKGGHWTIENLISYHIDGSGFMHVKAGAGNNGGAAAGTLDGMATEQGYYALVAYQRMKDGKTSLYDMSDVSISEGGKRRWKRNRTERANTHSHTHAETETNWIIIRRKQQDSGRFLARLWEMVLVLWTRILMEIKWQEVPGKAFLPESLPAQKAVRKAAPRPAPKTVRKKVKTKRAKVQGAGTSRHLLMWNLMKIPHRLLLHQMRIWEAQERQDLSGQKDM